MIRTLTTVTTLTLLLAGCVEDVGKGKIAAEVTEVPKGTEVTAPATAALTRLDVDVAKSKVHALGAKITATHPIDFSKFEGSVGLAGSEVASVGFTVEVASLKADADRLTGHLKKEDFLFVDEYPTATFASTSVRPGVAAELKGGAFSHTVEGDLTIRGKTKHLKFPAAIVISDSEVRATTEFVIDRQDFGVTYPGKADDLVQDNVVLTIELTAPRGAAVDEA